jgi:hypothetical protein
MTRTFSNDSFPLGRGARPPYYGVAGAGLMRRSGESWGDLLLWLDAAVVMLSKAVSFVI